MEIIDGLACIRRMEKLGSYVSANNLKEFVLESNPGVSYYCKIDSPLAKTKDNIYLLIKPYKNCNQDKILHLTENIKKCMNLEFAVYPGQLKVQNVLQSCLKVNVQNKNNIPDIINAFKNEGAEFLKSKKIEAYTTLVNTKECISIKEIDNFVFQDKGNKDIHYLEIPYQLEWSEFKEIETHIKNTFGYKDFDTSLVSIFIENQFREFIRIYVNGGCTCESFHELRNKFSSKMRMQ